MKKNKNLIIILLLLGAVAIWFLINKKDTTLDKELADFAVEDTSSVSKIFLANKRGEQISLSRQSSGIWLVNDKVPARQDAINLLLYTMKAVEVRSPVGRFNYNNIIKNLSSSGVKVEVYQNEKLTKTYYVGGPTQDQLGTEMYLENSSAPFITHIPGFNGFLTPRYFTNYYEWISRVVFQYMPDNISQIKIVDKQNGAGSFTIKVDEVLKTYSLLDSNNNLVSDVNSKKVEGYLSFYQNLNFESVVIEMPSKLYDSLVTVGSFIDVEVTDKSNVKKLASFYRKPVSHRALGQTLGEGQKAPYDLDRIYTRINNDSTFLITQYELFNRLFRKVDEFKGAVPAVVTNK